MTESFCPVCYKRIPAELTAGDHIWMVKECPEHGIFAAMVERDPRWYFMCKEYNKKDIYPGYMINITGHCNIKCEHCFNENDGKHRDVASIVAEAKYHGDKAPFILTGGEPTLHPDLLEIINSMPGPVWMLTNGIKLDDDQNLFYSIYKSPLNNNGILNIGLSFHKESNGKDHKFVQLCRDHRLRIDTCFFVINSVDEIGAILETANNYRDVFQSVRIKAASNLWTSHNADNKIFISDMIAEVMKHGETEIDLSGNNKISYACLKHRGMKIKLVSWYDKYNIDLKDIDCPPYITAKDGSVNNFVTSAIINEKSC